MRQILLTLTFLLSISLVRSQDLLHYTVPDDSITGYWLNQSIASGIGNPDPRCNVAGDTCLLEIFNTLADPWMGVGYTVSQALDLLAQPSWDNTIPDPIPTASRIDQARQKGYDLTNAFFVTMSNNFDDGTWTIGNVNNVFTNFYMDMIIPLREGQIDVVLHGLVNNLYTPTAQITQPMLDALEVKLQKWVNDHPHE